MTLRVTIQGRPPVLPSKSELTSALTEAMVDASDLVANAARENINVRTGYTRSTIRTMPVQPTANGVQGGVEVGGAGRFLEDGTATFSTNPDVRHEKYPILPKNKKALAWPGAQGPSPMSTGGLPLSYIQAGTPNPSGGHYPPMTGAHVRLSGAIRTPIRKLLAAGAIPFNSVYVIRRGVMHPGIRPRPFLAPALKDSLPQIKALLAAAIQKRLSK